jgi:hypothetical protein
MNSIQRIETSAGSAIMRTSPFGEAVTRAEDPQKLSTAVFSRLIRMKCGSHIPDVPRFHFTAIISGISEFPPVFGVAHVDGFLPDLGVCFMILTALNADFPFVCGKPGYADEPECRKNSRRYYQ